MEKTKNYPLVKFPIEIILSAIKMFNGFLPKKSNENFYSIWKVRINGEEWTLDNIDQFIVEYQKPELESCLLAYKILGEHGLSVSFHKGYSSIYDDTNTAITVSLPKRESIERIFGIFEEGYEKLKSQHISTETPPNSLEKSSQFFSISVKPPSCFLDKKILSNLERYIVQRADGILSKSPEKKSPWKIIIKDSYGDTALKKIDDFNQDLFDNGIESIRLEYGERYRDILLIETVFSKKSHNSTLEILYTGENARETVEGIHKGILRVLSDSKTRNSIYHPPLWVWFLLIWAAVSCALLLLSQIIIHNSWSWILSTTLLFIFVYLIAPKIKPYITFATRRNQSIAKWSNWLIETILGFLVITILTLIISNL